MSQEENVNDITNKANTYSNKTNLIRPIDVTYDFLIQVYLKEIYPLDNKYISVSDAKDNKSHLVCEAKYNQLIETATMKILI